MKRLIAIGAATLAAVLGWSALVIAATFLGWGQAPIAPRGDVTAFMDAVARRAAEHQGPLALVLIEDGKVAGERYIAERRPLDRDSLFQVASLSKWITAWGVMTLVEDGRIDLDAPVETYLSRWRLPASEFDNRQVTVRRLLSHTAGLTDGLGYAGVGPDQPLQTLEGSLTRPADATPEVPGVVRVGARPGSGWRYSGGGYTLLQLVVEEVSGEPFSRYMRRRVLEPLGMTRSTFDTPSEGVAESYAANGSLQPLYRYSATGAASLYTSPGDLTRFLQAQLPGPDGARPGRGVLSEETLAMMWTPHASRFGVPIWGLGAVLYAPSEAGGFIVGHDGGNRPAVNTTARLDPASGDGIVVLETGDRTLASRVGSDWVFWKTGKVDVVALSSRLPHMLLWLAAGAAVILLIGAVAGWRAVRRQPGGVVD